MKRATALATNKVITSLDLTHNKITGDGALALATMVMANDCRIKINLSSSASMLVTNENGMNINFSKINVDNDEAKKIATALALNKTVTTLDVTDNKIGD